jgi:hypothetical protein
LRLWVKQDRGTGMIEKLRVIAIDRRIALTSAAKTLKNDPVVQDWWLCVGAYLMSAFLIGSIISDTWHRYLLIA